MKQKTQGFTIAELLIVVAIIAVLVAVAIPAFTSQLEKSRQGVDLSNLRGAYAAARLAEMDSGVTIGTNTASFADLAGTANDELYFWYDPDSGDLIPANGTAPSDEITIVASLNDFANENQRSKRGKATSSTLFADTSQLPGETVFFSDDLSTDYYETALGNGDAGTRDKAIVVTFTRTDGIFSLSSIWFNTDASAPS